MRSEPARDDADMLWQKKEMGSHMKEGEPAAPLPYLTTQRQWAMPYCSQRQFDSRHACMACDTCPSTLP